MMAEYANAYIQNLLSSIAYRFFLPIVILHRIYKQTVLPILDYGSTVLHDCGTI